MFHGNIYKAHGLWSATTPALMCKTVLGQLLLSTFMNILLGKYPNLSLYEAPYGTKSSNVNIQPHGSRITYILYNNLPPVVSAEGGPQLI